MLRNTDAVVPQSSTTGTMVSGGGGGSSGGFHPHSFGRPGMYPPPKYDPYHPMNPYHMGDGRQPMMHNPEVPLMYPGMDMQGNGYAMPMTHIAQPEPRMPHNVQQVSNAVAARQQRSARQAAKANNRTAAIVKRKAPTPQPQLSDDDLDDDSDDGEVPDGDESPSAADIAKTKYNHVEDEKERKRLKRLLRNRVSAQQARERKKAYLSTLESRSKDIETRNAELEQRVNTLERENYMLRQVVKATTSNPNARAQEGED